MSDHLKRESLSIEEAILSNPLDNLVYGSLPPAD